MKRQMLAKKVEGARDCPRGEVQHDGEPVVTD